MTNNNQTSLYQTHYQDTANTGSVFDHALRFGITGAIIGGAIAAAQNIRRQKDGECEMSDVVKNTAKEAGVTGIATMAGSVAANATGDRGILSAIVFASATVGAKYLIDGVVKKKNN